ncbi:fungal-specific transcription factor domain-containing protein [Podospora appendiculata]|uniref:Fungal-specific transcription factor domain-containing protein n=1 Tax=Podospora appendiculata TaxID=314037 RepID=A0AAE0XM72_9PEZI|nr:fungal-specific transcription factor domain-containing protein [Podospora appendiculata]
MPATTKQRTKCFTGCWTCRSRRVKCDEATPTCRRCRQFGVQCEGYGVRLSWVHYDARDLDESSQLSRENDDGGEEEQELHVEPEQTTFRASRRAPNSGSVSASTLPRLSSPELDVTLRQIDDWSVAGESRGLHHAGFSVFPVAQDLSGGDPYQLDAPLSLSSKSSTGSLSNDRRKPASSPATSDGSRGQTQPKQRLEWEHGGSHQIIQTPGPPRREHLQPPQTPLPRHLDALTMPSHQKRLIHHWVTFTSRKLVLLDEPHNPCRTMMLPMALQGLISTSSISTANIAIFHALCASSAYNLFELGGRGRSSEADMDRALALHHDQQAIHHLRHNLARVDEHQDASFAMAIMACIAVEAISGTTQRWRTHVAGGLAYLAKLQASSNLDEAVLAPFRCHMLSMAVLCDVPIPSDLASFLVDAAGLADGLEFTFPYYGVSRSFLQAHHRMNEYATTTTTTIRPPNTSPALERELDAFELQLYLDFPALPPAPHTGYTSIIHHTAKTFYYAGLVFFQRSIRGAAPAAVQTLVDLGVAELEAVERAGRGELGCMMLWPVLVLGAECATPGLQARVRAWFRGQRRLGFRNLVVLEELVVAVWRARDMEGAGEEDGWRGLIVQPRFDVFRL